MTTLLARVLDAVSARGLIPSFPEGTSLPLPSINKVEFYPTFRCNDRCTHCITRSGPEREESLSPDDAATASGL